MWSYLLPVGRMCGHVLSSWIDCVVMPPPLGRLCGHVSSHWVECVHPPPPVRLYGHASISWVECFSRPWYFTLHPGLDSFMQSSQGVLLVTWSRTYSDPRAIIGNITYKHVLTYICFHPNKQSFRNSAFFLHCTPW